ncbi:hypothetical protein JAAARDRAFT_625455 [Jaapia argillacea MUCL 33604]|uniref:Uncharacterized protein n=1 Tax=Jaapia argillacea MUCL 33604 TaxID=933084 RepID=A0A067QAE8_9AGAM|nr:hypothetical protein JAAARDRAFT_625455 [Jaapia argillacea MUCL 33604]
MQALRPALAPLRHTKSLVARHLSSSTSQPSPRPLPWFVSPLLPATLAPPTSPLPLLLPHPNHPSPPLQPPTRPPSPPRPPPLLPPPRTLHPPNYPSNPNSPRTPPFWQHREWRRRLE